MRSQIFRASALALALAASAGWALPVQAQSIDSAAVQQELAAMRAAMARMATRVDTLETQLAEARAKAEAAQAAAAAIPPPTATAKPPTEVTWDGAPKLAGGGGWSFKPRGRIQVDTAGVNAPRGIAARTQLGFGTEFRRAYLGFDGAIPGGFGYRAEIDVANSNVQLTDVYLSYKASPEVTLTLGHQKAIFGLEEQTSDLFTSFMERAAFTSAFGFERRLGLMGAYAGKELLVQAGVYADDAASLNTDTNNSYSVHGRVVFMPKIGSGQLHVGALAYHRAFNDSATTTRYMARPFVHTTDLRLIDTRAFSSRGERGFGGELAYVNGRFHASAEAHWLRARRPGVADPTFHGGYAEVGYLLTDDATAYKGGVYDRIRPKNPVNKGGIGAVQVNARYDWLDLNDAGIVGGRQRIAALSLIWMPVDYVRFVVNYGHLWIRDAAVPAGIDRDYSADALGVRAQVDF